MKTGEATPLIRFMERELKKIYSRHLAVAIPKVISKFCYGCVHGKREDKYHYLCRSDPKIQIRFGLYHALEEVNEFQVMEEYGDVVGIGGLEWVEIFDEEYRREEWIMSELWHEHVVGLIMQRWHSEGDSQLLSQVVADQEPSHQYFNPPSC